VPGIVLACKFVEEPFKPQKQLIGYCGQGSFWNPDRRLGAVETQAKRKTTCEARSLSTRRAKWRRPVATAQLQLAASITLLPAERDGI
jgi:hypothetical protein